MLTSKESELKAKSAERRLCSDDRKVLSAIGRRLAAHERSEKNEDYTSDYLLNFMSAKLLKPQRLVSLSYGEEERRALRTWWRFDHKLYLARFAPLEQLREVVRKPRVFRDNVRNLVIYMSDQIPMWLKLKPGQQA